MSPCLLAASWFAPLAGLARSAARVRRGPVLALALALLGALPCRAQVPAPAEFEAAVDAARPLALAQGLVLRTDGLWLEQLRSGMPMMALRRGPNCHIGYNAYVAQRRFADLFPALPRAQAAAWLGALVRHELMHCVSMVAVGSAAAAGVGKQAKAGLAAMVVQEALADLALAHHLDSTTPEADALITRLIGVRAGSATSDPGHDTAGVLRCYLHHPQRHDVPHQDVLSWLQQMQLWQARCPSTPLH